MKLFVGEMELLAKPQQVHLQVAISLLTPWSLTQTLRF